MKLPLEDCCVREHIPPQTSSSSDVVMLFSNHAVSILILWVQSICGRPALQSNGTTLGTSIPTDFTIDRRFGLPIRFSPEAGYFNIIAALCDISAGDFASTMHPSKYRTTRFRQPIISISTRGDGDVPRRYIVWGLFLTAFYLRANQRFSLAFFVLEWNGKEVAGLGIGGRSLRKRERALTTTSSASSLLPLSPLKDVRELRIAYEYNAGAESFEQGAVYMTVIGALTTAAPFDLYARITETWISFLNDEPCVFIVVPSQAARTAPPYFIYEDLNLILAKTSDFLADHARYSPLSMNISIDGIEVAKAALTSKFEGHGLALSAIA